MNISTPRLLISDDDRDLRETLGSMFLRRGMNVQLAADGGETLEALEAYCPHLLLVDMNMPVRTGLEILESLQKRPQRVPAILMSAQLDEDLVERALQAKAAGVQTKPFSVREIQAVVDQALRVHHGFDSRN